MAADIAFVFHWSAREIEELDFSELVHWHQLAAERMKALYGKL